MNIPIVTERITVTRELDPLPAYKPTHFGKKPTVLVVGASGLLGKHVVSELLESGYRVKAISRNPSPQTSSKVEWHKADACEIESLRVPLQGVDVVISCLGASLAPTFSDKKGFFEIDLEANKNVLSAALYNDVSQFVYVSLFVPRFVRKTAYIKAHEAFVDLLKDARIAYSIIRPTGFFGSFVPLIEMARKGRTFIIGFGRKKTNPVHEQDVARACIEAMEKNLSVLEVGGPDVFTRKELAQLAGYGGTKKPGVWMIPPFLFKLMIAPLSLIHRRLFDVMDFVHAVSTCDAIASPNGTQRFQKYVETYRKSR